MQARGLQARTGPLLQPPDYGRCRSLKHRPLAVGSRGPPHSSLQLASCGKSAGELEGRCFGAVGRLRKGSRRWHSGVRISSPGRPREHLPHSLAQCKVHLVHDAGGATRARSLHSSGGLAQGCRGHEA